MHLSESLSLINLLILIFLIPFWRSYYFFPKDKINDFVNPLGRLDFFDFLKGVSIIAVIIIHVSYFYWENDEASRDNLYLILINNLSRFTIPVFFICSGILLTPWSEIRDKKGFFKRKFFRIFLPYVLLVSMMAVYYKVSLAKYLLFLFNGQALVPFYFIIVLAQLYLLYPLISKYRNNRYFLPVTFGISFVSALFFWSLNIMGAPIFLGFLFFFAYGIYMRDYFLSGERLKTNQISLWFTVVALYLLITILIPGNFYNYQFFYGLAIFNILYYYRDILRKYLGLAYKLIANIGIYSLWIFLFHFLIESVVYKIIIGWPIGLVGQSAFIIAITLILSYLSARILSFGYLRMLKSFDIY